MEVTSPTGNQLNQCHAPRLWKHSQTGLCWDLSGAGPLCTPHALGNAQAGHGEGRGTGFSCSCSRKSSSGPENPTARTHTVP